MNILEQYKKRLDVSEKYFQNTHAGQRLDGTKKLAIATCLNNINKFMNEGFAPSAATQANSTVIGGPGLGEWKKFCLNITTLGLPNCIAPELVVTQPLTAFTGFVTYTDFVASGEVKGGFGEQDLLNGAYGLGQMTEGRMNYTAAHVVETVDNAAGLDLVWAPLVKNFFEYKDNNDDIQHADAKVVRDGKIVGYAIASDPTATTDPQITDFIDLDGATQSLAVGDKVAYVYDNVVIPQKKLVHLRAVQRAIPLRAKCRRIAITYSQIAQFQAQTDYNMDLNQQLVAQASGELAYEIDSEVIDLLDNAAREEKALTFSRLQPVGVSLRDHYEAFARVIEQAKAIVYNRTQKYAPNYMIIAADCMDVLAMNSQFRPANTGAIYGPYFAGTFGPLKVYVSPMLEAGKFIIGVNGSDLQTSAAVYAPYMPIVPTQLLGLPDGTMTQGFATLYDLQLLARCEYDEKTGEMLPLQFDSNGCTIGTKSPLLVAGRIKD